MLGEGVDERSLCLAHVVQVEPIDTDFAACEEVRDVHGEVIARGMVLCDADTLRTIKGKRTGDLPAEIAHEVVHRDDLVVLA